MNATRNQTGREPTPTRFKLHDCEIIMRRKGAGKTLVFLHGAGGSSDWLPFMETLSHSYDVIVPEHPGYGASDDPDWLERTEDLAYFYLDFLKALDLTDVHLLGLSLGGWIAAELAIRDTSRLASLTLVDAAGNFVEGAESVDIFLITPEERFRATYYDQDLALSEMKRLMTPENTDTAIKNNFTTAKLTWQPRAYNPAMLKWLKRIELPTLVIWGANDRAFGPEYADSYQALIPGAEKVIIPECGHVPNVEKPEEFIAAVADFIGRVAT